MANNDHIWRALAAEFPKGSVKYKPIGRGEQAPYITARHVMNRLDEVLGPENWTAEFTAVGSMSNSVQCRLKVLLPDGGTAVKCDVGGAAKMDDDGDDDKSAYSDALKRAAVHLGVGRYLYGEGVPRCYGGGEAVAIEAQAPAALEPPAPAREAEPRGDGPPPITGKDLYRWAKDHDHLADLTRIGKSWNHPPRMLDWNADQVEAALHELHTKERRPANGRASRWG